MNAVAVFRALAGESLIGVPVWKVPAHESYSSIERERIWLTSQREKFQRERDFLFVAFIFFLCYIRILAARKISVKMVVARREVRRPEEMIICFECHFKNIAYAYFVIASETEKRAK